MKILQTTLVASLLAFSGHSNAQTINDDFTPYEEGRSQSVGNTSLISRKTSYDYLSFSYITSEYFDSDWTDLVLAGSYSILPVLSVRGDLITFDADDFDGEGQQLLVGLDFHQARSDQLDFLGSLSLRKGSYESGGDESDDFKLYLSAGARYFVNDKLDFSGGLRFTKSTAKSESFDDRTTTSIILSTKVRYFISETVELGASLENYSTEYQDSSSQSFLDIGINARAYLTPKASVGLSYYSADNYSDYSEVTLNARYDFKPIH